MNTQQIADRLIELCKQGKWEEVQSELYSKDIVSLEMPGTPMERCEGIEAVQEKGKKWEEMTEVHSMSIGSPIIADNWFAVTFTMDCTDKSTGKRNEGSEIAVYQIKDGKIIQEQFFYPMEGC